MRDIELSASGSLELLTEELERGGRSLVEVERILFYMSRYARAAAIGSLLAYADTAAFLERLTLSAKHRRRLLVLVKEGQRPFSRFTCTSQISPLCDAMAAGADELARELALLSSPSRVPREEFEEDFHYGRFLNWLALGGEAAPAQAESILGDFERSLGDGVPTRLEVCRALLERDQKLFDSTLGELITQRVNFYAAKAKSLGVRDEHFETERFVFVEGLALLRMAGRRGLVTEAEYPLIPGLVRR